MHVYTVAILDLEFYIYYYVNIYRFPEQGLMESHMNLKEVPKTEDFITFLCLRGTCTRYTLYYSSLRLKLTVQEFELGLEKGGGGWEYACTIPPTPRNLSNYICMYMYIQCVQYLPSSPNPKPCV